MIKAHYKFLNGSKCGQINQVGSLKELPLNSRKMVGKSQTKQLKTVKLLKARELSEFFNEGTFKMRRISQ